MSPNADAQEAAELQQEFAQMLHLAEACEARAPRERFPSATRFDVLSDLVMY